MRILERLTLLSPGDLIPYAEALTSSMALLLEPAVPRRILQTVNKLWISLNTVMPRRYTLRMLVGGRRASGQSNDLLLDADNKISVTVWCVSVHQTRSFQSLS